MEKMMYRFIAFFNKIDIFVRVNINRIKIFKKLWKHYQYDFDLSDAIFMIDMELFKNFYENGGIDYIDWDSTKVDKKARAVMGKIYNYYFERKASLEEVNMLSDEYWKSKHSWFGRYTDMLTENTKEEGDFLKHMWQIEQYIYEQDTKFLVELAKIHKYLSV